MNRKEFLQKAGIMGIAIGLPLNTPSFLSSMRRTSVEVATDNTHSADQIAIRLVESMPDMPTPYKIKNWKEITERQDTLLYNFNAKGKFLPLIWWDDSQINFPIRSFGLPSYVGRPRCNKKQSDYESLPVIGSVVGASLIGIDKSNYHGHDFVTMCKQFFNTRNGVDLIVNMPDSKPANSFWYEIWPGMAFSMLVDQYPQNKDIAQIMRWNDEKWIKAIEKLSRGRSYPDFNFTSYSFKNHKGVYNGRWHEPDAAAGLAWLEFAAWKKWGESKFLQASKSCMEYLQNRPAKEGPYYEILMPYGAYIAVRMNAELGTSYDELKMLNWCFDGNNTDRYGWGVTTEKWGKYDAAGLVGQKKLDNYAFAMNTFSQAAALVPVTKYNPSYAETIGKWMLNLANASRLFYADEHPKNKQTSALWQGDPDHAISYEGARKNLDHDDFSVYKGILANQGPYAVGDQVKQLSSFTDICPYGSAWVGMLAAIVNTTNVKGILKLDCNATDFFSSDSMDSYLIYNPYKEQKTVELKLGKVPVNVYDRVSKKFIAKKSVGKIQVSIMGNTAKSLALIPSNYTVSIEGKKLMANSEVIDYYFKRY